MTTIHFLRHGPTHQKAMIGWTDVDVDLSQVDQLKRINKSLPQEAICIASDLRRASDTLSAVQGGRLREPDAPDLREFNFGEWENREFADVSQEHPDLLKDYYTNPGNVAPPGGESWNDVERRTSSVLDAFVGETDHLIVACHYGVVLAQLGRFAKLPTTSAISFAIDHLSLTSIEVLPGGEARVLRVNHHP